MPLLPATPPQLLPPQVAVVAVDAATTLPRRVGGRVSDGKTHRPIAGVLVTQPGEVASAFTDKNGRYTIYLDPEGESVLVFSAAGYETRRLALQASTTLNTTLAPVSAFVPAAPFIKPVAAFSPSDLAPLNSGVSFSYRFFHQSLGEATTQISGNVTNDFRLGARFRYRPWLFDAEAGHYQSHIDLPQLSPTENPAFRPSTWMAGVRFGYFWTLDPNLEAALMAGYRYRNVVPNNNNIPYTGTDLDFTQSAHAFGPVGDVAWKPWGGNIFLDGQLGLYPLVIASASAPGQPFAGSALLDAQLQAGYQVMPGLRAYAGYEYEGWFGNGNDQSHIFAVGVKYTPAGLPRGNEP